MNLDGAFRDIQLPCDHLVAQPLCKTAQNLPLPVGEITGSTRFCLGFIAKRMGQTGGERIADGERAL